MRPSHFATALVALAASSVLALPVSDFAVEARYEPPAKGQTQGAVAVAFSPLGPELKLNEQPAPRLALDPAQVVLEDRQPPPGKMITDPEHVKAIDTSQPVRFPVALRKAAPKGTRDVKATVTFFYCSKREGWCRRGREAVLFSVTVP